MGGCKPRRPVCAGEGERNMSLPLDQVICGDNCDVLGTLPRECIDLVVTSPPYDDLRTYGGHSWDFYGVAWQLKRVLKPGGVIVWVVNDKTEDGSETGSSFKQALHFREIGLRLHDSMVWEKTGGSLCLNHNRYEPTSEFMFVLSSGKPNTFNGLRLPCKSFGRGYPGGNTRQGGDTQRGHNTPRPISEDKLKGNVWGYDGNYNGSKDKIAFNHPAPFPEALAADHIRSWSNEGDIVLDPFNGSGTTTKMARELGRRYIGIDVNEEYCQIARKRLEQQLLWEAV
jgi:DNA modification methylase